jgi:hypothetical protein
MRSFAEKSKTTEQNSSAESSKPEQPLSAGRVRSRRVLSMHTILHLQRTIGNQGAGRLLQAEPKHFEDSARTTNTTRCGHDLGQIPVHDKAPLVVQHGGSAASSNIYAIRGLKSGEGENKTQLGRTFGGFNRPPSDAKWRIPPSADLQAMLTAGTVDEAVVRSRVRRLLDRMNREGRLRVTATLADIGPVLDEIFPAPGFLDQAAYDRYIDPADRTMVYYSVREASTPPHAADRSDLRNAMLSAAATAQSVATDEAGLRSVFGSAKWTTAQNNYRLIHARLTALSADIENSITTDYNLDAQETFLGGWASFGSQHMHLLSEVVADPLTAESKATLLHEAAHLAAPTIDDHVYYGSPGFEAADHATKINNAAHYEELPRRIWGASRYSGLTFTPGVSSSGAPLTTEERIRAGGVEYYRRVWDAAADFDDLIKQIRRDQLDGTISGASTEARLLEVSPLMDLTLHEQMMSPVDITQLDVTTSESVVRAMSMAGDHVESLTNVIPMGPFLSAADEIAAGVNLAVDAGMAAYGGLLGDATRDRQLVDWLHSHYRSVYP